MRPSAKHLKADFLAGVVVFLVALPLCLGIALASNAPLVSGLIAGIVAGLVVSLLSGSELSVSGPAAGLTVIVASAISDLGGFSVFLTAVFLSGIFQLLLGLFRAGSLSAFFPSSVIHGMLAAIGITIVLKQIPHGLGTDTDYLGDLNFWNVTDKENTFSEILVAIQAIDPVATAITLIGLFLMIQWPKVQKQVGWLEYLPSALMVVLVGLVINMGVGALFPAHMLGTSHLVQIPETNGIAFMWSNFQFPPFSQLFDPAVLAVAGTLALVGSLETLLSLEATDKLDPEGRISNGSKELIAQGVGNSICGLIGGLPMTAVIVRSSTNVYAGGKTRLSAFFHGALLLICVAIFTAMLNQIPLSALAAILLFVGYRLASPAVFRKVLAGGKEQFIPFVVTIGTVILTDLLIGVLTGLVVGFVVLLKSSVYGAVIAINEGTNYFIKFTKDVSFSNKAYFRGLLTGIPNGSTVFIDGTRAMFIDHDIYELIDDFRQRASDRGISVVLIEVKGKEYNLVNRKRKKWNETLSSSPAAS